MGGMKYITYDRPYSYRAIIIFPSDIDHAMAANAFNIDADIILGAGFVSRHSDGNLYCHGSSHSLKVLSRGDEDTAILDRLTIRD